MAARAIWLSRHTGERIELRMSGELVAFAKCNASQEPYRFPGKHTLASASRIAFLRRCSRLGTDVAISIGAIPLESIAESRRLRLIRGVVVDYVEHSPAANTVFSVAEMDRRIDFYAARIRAGLPCDGVPVALLDDPSSQPIEFNEMQVPIYSFESEGGAD
jgi:hypothetical protein